MEIIQSIKLSLLPSQIMPYIQVSLYPGRSEEQKQEFAKAVTKSAVEILKTKEDHVIIVFDENPKENWFLAGNQL